MARPPRGYELEEYSLPHEFRGEFDITPFNETQNSTILPLLLSSDKGGDGLSNPSNVEVNPKHSAFAEFAQVTCYNGSIIPNLRLRFSANITEPAYETDKIHRIPLEFMPIYMSFIEKYDSVNQEDGGDIKTLLNLTHSSTNKEGYINWSGTKMAGFTSNLPTEVPGLTTTQKMESTSWDKNKFWDNMKYGTNRKLLQQCVGNYRRVMVGRKFPFVYSNRGGTYPSVKRMNDYTFCGMLFHVPYADDANFDNLYDITDITSATTAIHITYSIMFDEWNPNFEQMNN